MDKFKVGEVVRLKSGGCNMVIGTVTMDDTKSYYAICNWQDDSLCPHQVEYPFECLEEGLSR